MPDGGSATPVFPVVQVDVAGTLGPGVGRWVLRGHANQPERVVVLQSVEGPRRRLGPRRRRRRGGPPADGVVPMTRATVADARPLAEGTDPAAWLTAEDLPGHVRDALVALRRLLHLHALAAETPPPAALRPEDLLRATVAVASGPEAAEGTWTDGRDVPVGRRSGVRRSGRGLEPDERLADLLAGRDVPLAAELLLLRAEEDLAAGRDREAALQLRVALEAAIAELEPWRTTPGLDDVIGGLRDERDAVAAMAAATLRGGLDAEHAATAGRVAAALRRASRRRVAAERRPMRPGRVESTG